MKLEFRDTLEINAIDLYFEIKDNVERDITPVRADIKWTLTIDHKSWGIEKFSYELGLLIVPINVQTVQDGGELKTDTIYAEIKFNPHKHSRRYECRIYEEILVDGVWKEEEYVKFPINLAVEERPATDTDNRSQMYVKFIELDLTSEVKKLKLTI